MLRVVTALSMVVLALACGTEEPKPAGPKDLRMDIPEAPPADEGILVVSPDFTIPAGKDVMICWVPDVQFPADRLIEKFETYQSQNGHHLIGMSSVIPRQPGEQFDCTSTEGMASVEPLINPTSGTSAEGSVNVLPEGMHVRVKAGTRIVMQSHYVNYTDEEILVRDVGILRDLPANKESIEASYLVLNSDSFEVPGTNERFSHTTECTVDVRFQFASMIGHMHEWGKSIKVEHVDMEGAATTIYEVDAWTAAYRDAPPIESWPIDDPLVFEAGDTLRLTCEWQNDTNEGLRFPHEMCATLFSYFPALPEGFIICD